MNIRIWLLAFGNFAAGTGSMLVTGLLDAIASDLAVSVSVAGQLSTAFAVTAALTGPVLATATSRLDRRRVLIIALLLFTVGTAAAPLARDYPTLLATRVVAAVGVSLYTPHAATAAALIAGPLAQGRAIATVFGGFVMATVIGVPLGTALGGVAGWRVAFAASAALPLIALLAIAWKLPHSLRVAPADVQAWGQLLRSPALMLMIGTTATQLAGQLTVFVYLAPLLKAALGLDTAGVGWMFMLYGLSSVAGNIVVARTIDRAGPGRLVNLALAGTIIALVAFPFAQQSLPAAVAVLMFWGLTSFAINAGSQARLVAVAPWLAGAALPLNSSAIYVGQALGAVVGGVAIARVGYEPLGWIGAVIVGVALGASWFAGTRAVPRPHDSITSTR